MLHKDKTHQPLHLKQLQERKQQQRCQNNTKPKNKPDSWSILDYTNCFIRKPKWWRNKSKPELLFLCVRKSTIQEIFFVYIHVIKKMIHKIRILHNTEMLGHFRHYRSYEETKISTKIDTRHQQSQGSNSDINSMKIVMLS